MIRVTIEMLPGGSEAGRRHMATIDIWNDVKTTLATKGSKGVYRARFSRISQQGSKLGWYDKQIQTEPINRRQAGAVYRILHSALAEFLK